jgi:hypothetical protein
MGVGNNLSTTSRLTLTASLPANGVITIGGWSLITNPASGADWESLFFMEDASEDIGVAFRHTDGVFLIDTSGSAPATFGTSPTAGQRFFWMVTHAGAGAGNYIGYWGLSGATTLHTVNMAGKTMTPTGIFVLGNPYSQPYDGTADSLKMWTRVLTPDEVLNEMSSVWPKTYTNLYDVWPLWGTGDVVGYYGGHTWTVTGAALTNADNSAIDGGMDDMDWLNIQFTPPSASSNLWLPVALEDSF